MLFCAYLAASLIFSAVCQGKDSYSYDLSSSVSKPSVSFFESSLSPSSDYESANCRQALKDIMAQPKGAAYAYFKSLQSKIEKQAYLWLNSNTQIETANTFAAQNGVGVSFADAFGQIYFSTGTIVIPYNHFPEVYRSWALNYAVMNQGGPNMYFVFSLFNPTNGTILNISLDQATSSLPKNQLCFRKPGLNRLN